jgi:putative mRNA 3-end processing factor
MAGASLLQLKPEGLYCAAGDFYLDPWRPVERAIVTHAHADHARRGSRHYLAADTGLTVLRARLGSDARIETVAYGLPQNINRVRVSLHPAGHILGSAQVRLEHQGRIWVFSGDYRTEADATATAFEPLRCHVFITESTFGLPIYRWPSQKTVVEAIEAWWRTNQEAGKASLLFGYALGKAQRLLAAINPQIGPILTHGAVQKMNDAYRAAGVKLPQTVHVAQANGEVGRALILAPPSAKGSIWTRRFGIASTAFASGWMRIRGTRRRRAVDRGFVFSDHADWPGLIKAIRATQAEEVWVTHGYASVLAQCLREQGIQAHEVATEFEGETDDPTGVEPEAEARGEENGEVGEQPA